MNSTSRRAFLLGSSAALLGASTTSLIPFFGVKEVSKAYLSGQDLDLAKLTNSNPTAITMAHYYHNQAYYPTIRSNGFNFATQESSIALLTPLSDTIYHNTRQGMLATIAFVQANNAVYCSCQGVNFAINHTRSLCSQNILGLIQERTPDNKHVFTIAGFAKPLDTKAILRQLTQTITGKPLDNAWPLKALSSASLPAIDTTIIAHFVDEPLSADTAWSLQHA